MVKDNKYIQLKSVIRNWINEGYIRILRGDDIPDELKGGYMEFDVEEEDLGHVEFHESYVPIDLKGDVLEESKKKPPKTNAEKGRLYIAQIDKESEKVRKKRAKVTKSISELKKAESHLNQVKLEAKLKINKLK